MSNRRYVERSPKGYTKEKLPLRLFNRRILNVGAVVLLDGLLSKEHAASLVREWKMFTRRHCAGASETIGISSFNITEQ